MFDPIDSAPPTNINIINNPFVIQCPTCNLILADSFSLVNIEDGILFFKEKSDKLLIEENTSNNNIITNLLNNPHLSPSTFHILKCTCSSLVGISLHSAPKKYNGCSGTFCFIEERMKMYQLGSSTVIYRTLSDINEDVERLKEVISKIYSDHL
ncbi:hypothetical protein NUSPORA_02109 [Nucleospora cyclopteri]